MQHHRLERLGRVGSETERGWGEGNVRSDLGRQLASSRARLGSVMPPTKQGPHGVPHLEP